MLNWLEVGQRVGYDRRVDCCMHLVQQIHDEERAVLLSEIYEWT